MDCLPRAWVGNAIEMESARLRSAENTQLEVKRRIILDLQLGKRVAKVGFFVVTNFGPQYDLGYSLHWENFEKINPQKGKLTPTGSSSIAVKESASNAAYMTGKQETKQSASEDEYNEYSRTAACQRIIPPIREVYLHVKSNVHGVQSVTSHENFYKTR